MTLQRILPYVEHHVYWERKMPDIELTAHAKDMLLERSIAEDWLWLAIHSPHREWVGDDHNVHYAKTIKEREGRVLHVVVNPDLQPNRVVTIFFDRRLGRKGRAK